MLEETIKLIEEGAFRERKFALLKLPTVRVDVGGFQLNGCSWGAALWLEVR